MNKILPYRIKTKLAPGVLAFTYSEDDISIKYKTELILSFAIEKSISYPVAWTSNLTDAINWHLYACKHYQQYLI